ncbi:MAG: arylesterase [Desulfobacterales bacterium]
MKTTGTFLHVAVGLCLMLAACGQEQPPRPTPATGPAGTIVAVGDSLTEGLGVPEEKAYPALLQQALKDKGYDYRVVNAGISGETSSGARSRVEWVLRLAPDIVILETGANDGLRGVDPGLIRRNIAEMIDVFTKAGVVVVLAGMKALPNLGPAYSKMFADVYTDVARDGDLILIPFFLEGVAGISGLNQPDGIHPTAQGYAKVVEHILPYVIQAVARHQKQSR